MLLILIYYNNLTESVQDLKTPKQNYCKIKSHESQKNVILIVTNKI